MLHPVLLHVSNLTDIDFYLGVICVLGVICIISHAKG